jgi:glycosyltransferase involved in cell wall biosynthesis
LRRMQRQDSQVRKCFRELYQASSIVFASNLMKQTFTDKFDVVHAHDLFTLVAGTWLAQRTGAKLIYDAHEYEIARATKMQPVGNSIALSIEDACLTKVDRLVSVSPLISDLYLQRHPKLHIELVMNSPASPVVKEGDNAGVGSIRQMSNLSADQPLMVFTGGVQGPHRGLDKVLEAMKMLPQFHLAILGQRLPKADRWLKSAAKSCGVWNRVHLFHEVSADIVPAVISSADIAVCPIQDASLSYRLAMPNKLFEAAFADVPICVSNLPGLMSVVNDLRNGASMNQTDPGDIARTIQHVYENRASYKLSTETRKILMEKYSWDVQVQRLLTMYQELLV